jgi:uroporphyrinogen-III decarboxylase
MEPDMMEEVMAALADIQSRTYDLVADAVHELPIPYVNVGDNITAPMIGGRFFREYCLPGYRELAEKLDATGKDIPIFVHMDGDLKPLWDAIAESPVRGLDSFSPPPDNDTRVADAVRLWPEMRLWLNFPSSIHLASEKRIYEVTREILEEGGHTGRLQIQISENVPPGVWRTSFPQIVRAIDDFGPPKG